MPNLDQFKNKKERNEWYKKYREKRRLKFRKYNREYNKKWRKKFGYEAIKRYSQKYPEKIRAKNLLGKAVYRGHIIRGSCVVCGKKKAQAHHEDYSRPYYVIWLCPVHHKEVHLKKLSTPKRKKKLARKTRQE